MSFTIDRLKIDFSWRQLLARAVDFTFPKQCIGCKAFSTRYICTDCVYRLQPIDENACQRCSALIDTSGDCLYCEYGVFQFDSVHAVFQMSDAAQKAVHHLKYTDLRAIAPEMGTMMGEFIETRDVAFDVIMPLPIHPKRARYRGYNQSELLCRAIATVTGRRLDSTSLLRTRYAPPQVTLKRLEARVTAVANAFTCTAQLNGQNVLLVDDVVTTGNTVNEATKALKAADAGSVHILSFTRGSWLD